MKKLLLLLILLTSYAENGWCRGKLQGWVEKGGSKVTINNGLQSTQTFQRSYPGATVTVKLAGTSTNATIYSDAAGTAKSNPFSADSSGHWFFYGDDGCYDVTFSGSTAYTLSDMCIGPVTVFKGACDGSTNNDTAWSNAIAALPANGGTIVFPKGTCVATSFNPTKHNLIYQGAGKEATILKGSGAGEATVYISGYSRGSIRDLTIDGAGVKTTALSLGGSGAGGAGEWTFENVAMYGGTTYGAAIIGNNTSNPDISANTFINCRAGGGAFGSVSPSTAQILVTGSNTLLIAWFGGAIFGGQVAVNLKMIGGDWSGYHINWANATFWNVDLSDGQFRDYNSHSEGTGGFFRSAIGSQGIASGQHFIVNGQITNTGANTGGVAVQHADGRQLTIIGTFFNEDVQVTNGRIFSSGTTFGATGSFIVNVGGTVFGPDIDGGHQIAKNTWLRFGSSTPASYLGASNSSGFGQDVVGYQEMTLSSAADVNGPNRNSMILVCRDVAFGGMGVFAYEQNSTPVIITQVGSVFVTGAPGADQIQIKTRGIGLGVAFRAGANRNGALLSCSVLASN